MSTDKYKRHSSQVPAALKSLTEVMLTGGIPPQDVKPILASSIKVPSMGAWELPNSKSPALYAPPDMNSEWNLL